MVLAYSKSVGDCLSFNGAAPTRARNGIGHEQQKLRLNAELQRGRAQAGAEWIASPTCTCDIMPLQRGRAHAGAEWRT